LTDSSGFRVLGSGCWVLGAGHGVGNSRFEEPALSEAKGGNGDVEDKRQKTKDKSKKKKVKRKRYAA